MLDVRSGDVLTALDAGLAEARGEFVLAIEASERVVKAHRRQLAALLTGGSVGACRVRFRPRPGFTRYWEPRIFRRDPDFRFRGLADRPLRLDAGGIAARGVHAIVESDVEIDHIADGGEDPREQTRTVESLAARLAEDRWPPRPS